MSFINLFEAKTHLSRLVEEIESGLRQEVVISRHGRPVARLVPYVEVASELRIGVARGKFSVPKSIDGANEEIARLFQTKS